MASSEKLYGLIGYPLGHSFSQGYFNNKFASEGIDAEYLNFEIPAITDLAEIIATHPALRGLNVTIPYKQAVIPYLDEIDPTARKIGAVNVIRVSRNAAGHVHLKASIATLSALQTLYRRCCRAKTTLTPWCLARAALHTPLWPDCLSSESPERSCLAHPDRA